MGNSVSSAMARVRSMPESCLRRSPVKPARTRRQPRLRDGVDAAQSTAVRQRRAPGDANNNQVDDPGRLPAERGAPELRERLRPRLSDAPPDQRIRVGRRAGVQRQDQEARQHARAAARGHASGEREDAASHYRLEERHRGLRLGHGAAASLYCLALRCVELALRRRDGIAARAQGCYQEQLQHDEWVRWLQMTGAAMQCGGTVAFAAQRCLQGNARTGEF